MSGIKLKHMAVMASVLALASGVVVFSSTDVFAGFEWKSSAPRPAAAPAPQEPIVWQKTADGGEVGMPVQKVAPVESMPVPLTAAPMAEASTEAVVPAPDADILSGFGSDLPMIVAVQQIVPAGHDVFIKEGVSANTILSWRGGKPWRQVLADALSPTGLSFRIEGKSVAIGYFGADRAVVAASPSVAKVDKIPADMLSGNEMAATAAERRAEPAMKPQALTAKEPKDNAVPEPVNLAAAVRETSSVELQPMPPAVDVGPPPPAVPVSTPVAAPVTQLSAQERHDNTPVLVPPAPSAQPVWLAERGRTLRDILAEWTKARGVDLYWAMDYDYRMNENVSYNGTFEDAVARLMGDFSAARPQPFGQLHLAKGGPQVLVVNSYDLPR